MAAEEAAAASSGFRTPVSSRLDTVVAPVDRGASRQFQSDDRPDLHPSPSDTCVSFGRRSGSRLTSVSKKEGGAIPAADTARSRQRNFVLSHDGGADSASAVLPTPGEWKERARRFQLRNVFTTKRSPALEGVNATLGDLRTKLLSGSPLTAVEDHLSRHLLALERSLFAPSLFRVSSDIALSLGKPLIFVGVFAAALVLPERSSVAVFPGTESGATSTDLASAFSEDHRPIWERAIPKKSPAIAQLAELDEVRLPILREFAAEDTPKPETAAVLSVPFRFETPKKAVPESRPATDRRSLVKFISGLIAAFRPQLPDSSMIAKHIVELSGSEHVDPLYVAAVIAIESRFSSDARSGVGATGLMQLMPMTAGELAERHNIQHRRGGLTDPRTNIQLGIRYLKELEHKYKGNRFLALAAYNWGPANVDQTHGRQQNIPSSVQKYSKTILERTNNWRKHFARANENAELLAEVPSPPTHS